MLAARLDAGLDHRLRQRRQAAALGGRQLAQHGRQLLGRALEPRHALDIVANIEQRFADRIQIYERHVRFLLQGVDPSPSKLSPPVLQDGRKMKERSGMPVNDQA